MNNKLKLAIATLLGFSAACSTVKNVPAKTDGTQQESGVEEQDTLAPPRIVAMYGVRMPAQVKIQEMRQDPSAEEQLTPVAEKPADDTPAVDTKSKAKPNTKGTATKQTSSNEELTPVAEKPADDTPAVDTKAKGTTTKTASTEGAKQSAAKK